MAAYALTSSTTSTTTEYDPRICDPGGKGLILPLGGPGEQQLDPRMKVMLYGCGLVYCFLGVGVISDVFMSAIERVTSKKKRVAIPETDRFVTKNVWNETVANLTLMALGSSAPEILLAVGDVLKNSFYAGALGPSTIVGSAAFNLFVIIAVCINAIPNGETRQIKETQVFYITGAWSIFAYLWLLVIVSIISPPVIDIWEAALTVLFFPMLVLMSYLSDVGLLNKETFVALVISIFSDDSEDGEDQGEKGAVGLILGCLGCWCRKMGKMFCFVLKQVFSLLFKVGKGMFKCLFRSAVALLACCCKRKRGSADSEHEGGLEHGEGMGEDDEEGEDMMNYDDDADEDDEPILEEDGEPIDCEEGVLTFRRECMEVWVGREEMEVPIIVVRKNGSEGRVSAQYRMDGITATPGYDFEEDEGQLDFKSGITQCEIIVVILPKRPGEVDDVFQVILEDPDGGCILNPDSDGGDDACIITLILRNENGNAKGCLAATYRFLDNLVNVDEIWLGTSTWWEQILEAVFVNGSLEEQREAHWTDWVSHLFCFPWAFWYAFLTPPPVYVGGWMCFGVALIHIGVLTSIIGDMAELFGCCAGIADAITAVTFVALGTSLPDTFASKTAATQDEWADASVVNVTGSNSVNVFLGIGIPWLMAAAFWKSEGATEEWLGKYPDEAAIYPDGAFVVTGAGDLTFSVTVFTLAALICLTVIVVRRKVFGGELGGPPDMKATSSFLLIVLWMTYIVLQIWKSGAPEATATDMVVSVAVCIPAIIVLMIIFLILLQVLKISKKYIGTEGFWGIFVCVSLIGLRMVVFMMFQTEG